MKVISGSCVGPSLELHVPLQVQLLSIPSRDMQIAGRKGPLLASIKEFLFKELEKHRLPDNKIWEAPLGA